MCIIVRDLVGLLDPVCVAGSRVNWYETSVILVPRTMHDTCRVHLINVQYKLLWLCQL